MKISKLFHWLYASLMLLPFASVVSTTLYYSFNKNAVIPQVDKEVSREVDFNQLFNVHLYPNSFSIDGFDVLINDNDIAIVGSNQVAGYRGIMSLSFDAQLNHKYLYNVNPKGTAQGQTGTWQIYSQGSYNYYQIEDNLVFTPSYSGVCTLAVATYGDPINVAFNLNVIDLTQMFGKNNEPTANEFYTWFEKVGYDYTLSEHIVIPNYETIQVADNSINHFWLPSFGAIGYNIQSYISWLIGNVFGLNVVNGIGLVIVRLFTYWLIISICWLIFDVLMYVPNLVHKWLDKAAID